MGTVSALVLTFLLNAVWQAPLIAAVTGLCTLVMRRFSPAQRHALWSAAMLATVLIPLTSLNLPLAESHASGESSISPETMETRAVPVAPSAGGAIAIAYAVLVAFGLARTAAACRGVGKIRRAARQRPWTTEMRIAEEQCRAHLGLLPVPILCSSSVAGPLTIGYLNPIIVLPESFFRERSPEVLRSVIGHEMAHVVRRDYLRKILLEFVFIPVSFHPAAWLLRRRIDQTRELACDEMVTRGIVQPAAYAQSMLDVARSAAQMPKPAGSLGVLDGDILEQRIRMLLTPAGRFGPRLGMLALGLAAAVLLFFAVKAAGSAFGIATSGGLSGRVYDVSKAVVPGAKLILTERRTGARLVRLTSATGDYSFESLPVGSYTLTVEQPGFARFVLRRINPGRAARVNPVLQLGRISETLTVSAKLTN